MSSLPLTPKTLKGALVSISLTSLPGLVLIQLAGPVQGGGQ
jgi:hypothetical protein